MAIGGATAVLAAAVLAGISQTWTPQLGPDRQQAPDRGRDGPGLAAQPGAGTSRATDADGRGESADGAPSPAEDGQPGAGATGEAGSAPTGPGASPPSGGDGIGPPEASPAPGQPVPAPELAAELTTSGLSLLGLNLLSLTVTVTVSNPGSAPAATWEVVVDVQGQSVGDVSGAEYQADGVYAVFTPPAGHELPAGEVDELSFTIGGLAPSAPSAADCTIDGRPCD